MRSVRLLLILSLLAPLGTRASAQQPAGSHPSLQLARADSAFQNKAWQLAADNYQLALRGSPNQGAAWFRLAVSLENLGKGDEALAAYGHAIQQGAMGTPSELRSARIFAKNGNAPEAIAHMRKAAALGAGPNLFENEPAFASFRGSAEYADVLKVATAARYPCRDVHTFDFWVGRFDTAPWHQPNYTGHLDNTREYDGCMIVERFATNDGSAGGMSIAFYDVNRKAWRMVWNDDGNSSNDFEGSYRDGAMRFEGWVLDAQGKKILASNVLQNVSPDTIRHIYSTSPDGGKTWDVKSDGQFVRKRD